jgi:hypothetical protein
MKLPLLCAALTCTLASAVQATELSITPKNAVMNYYYPSQTKAF